MRLTCLLLMVLVPTSAALGCSSSSDASTSLCNRDRDPTGLFCVEGLRSATGAESQARDALAGGGSVVGIASNPLGSLNVDGLDEVWSFTFHRPGEADLTDVTVNVIDRVAAVSTRPAASECEVAQFLSPDTRRLVREAVHMYEDENGLFRMGDSHLIYEQRLACASTTGGDVHHLRFRLGGDPVQSWFVRFVDGEASDLCGPCMGSAPIDCAACP